MLGRDLPRRARSLCRSLDGNASDPLQTAHCFLARVGSDVCRLCSRAQPSGGWNAMPLLLLVGRHASARRTTHYESLESRNHCRKAANAATTSIQVIRGISLGRRVSPIVLAPKPFVDGRRRLVVQGRRPESGAPLLQQRPPGDTAPGAKVPVAMRRNRVSGIA